MAGSVNKVILIGNLGRDPEIRTMNSGSKVASFSMATSESWRDKNSGERREKTEWHNVVVFNENLVKLAEQYLKKGMKVFVEGQLQTRKWEDQGGQARYTTEVVLQAYRGEIQMLDGPSNRPPPAEGPDDYGRPSGRNERTDSRADNSPAALSGELDDEIPF